MNAEMKSPYDSGHSRTIRRAICTGAQVTFFLCVIFAVTGCSKNPSITLSNNYNECGGTLHVSGTGFTAGRQVQISATNTPGSPTMRKIASATADSSGNVSADIPYSWPAPQSLPGCAVGSTSMATITITATDVQSNSPAFATVDLHNCGMVWSKCPA